MREIAVDSPPGRMRAAQEDSSVGVRTSMKVRGGREG
jgi:hypothetical protein